jgi:selenocysteine-specific elongation factor
VLQPVAGKIRRRHLEIQERLEQLWSSEFEQRVLAAAWFAGFDGVSYYDLIRSAGIPVTTIETLIDRFRRSGELIEFAFPPNRKLLLHSERVKEVEVQILGVLATMHAENPLVTSHDRQKALARVDFIHDEQLLQAATERLIRAKKLVGDSRRIARADFKPKLSANQQKLKDRIVEAHVQAGFQPPEPKEFANQAGGNASALKDIYDVAVAEGLLVKITAEIFLSAAAEIELRARIRERLQAGPGLTVAEIRNLLGTTRKFAVPICEYLDRIGLTCRQGDLRVLAASI